jgi:hypothetical protein
MNSALDRNSVLPFVLSAGTNCEPRDDIQQGYVSVCGQKLKDAYSVATTRGTLVFAEAVVEALNASLVAYDRVANVKGPWPDTAPRLDVAGGTVVGNTYLFSKALQIVRSDLGQSTSNADQGAKRVSNALFVAYELEAKGESRSAAREIMAFIEDCLSLNSLAEPNRLLAEADVERMTSRSIIGLIRSTFVARKSLPAWEGAYARAWRRAEALKSVDAAPAKRSTAGAALVRGAWYT